MSGAGEVARYDVMRVMVQECATIDEALHLENKAEALEFYARQEQDRELRQWVSDIRTRAAQRVGELSRALDTAQGQRTELLPNGGKKLKEDVLAEAGLSKSQAYRYEELAAPPDNPEAVAAAEKARDAYFAEAKANGEPVTVKGLREVPKA